MFLHPGQLDAVMETVPLGRKWSVFGSFCIPCWKTLISWRRVWWVWLTNLGWEVLVSKVLSWSEACVTKVWCLDISEIVLNKYKYKHTHTHARPHAHTHTHTPTPTRTRTRTHTHAHTYMHIHTWSYMYLSTYLPSWIARRIDGYR